jgi:hypothetical protein
MHSLNTGELVSVRFELVVDGWSGQRVLRAAGLDVDAMPKNCLLSGGNARVAIFLPESLETLKGNRDVRYGLHLNSNLFIQVDLRHAADIQTRHARYLVGELWAYECKSDHPHGSIVRVEKIEFRNELPPNFGRYQECATDFSIFDILDDNLAFRLLTLKHIS